MRWDNTIGALAIPFGFAALLKTNLSTSLFQKNGEGTIGFAKIYDDIVRIIRHRIMLAKYKQDSNTLNFIAYANTLTYLRQTLYELFESDETGLGDELRFELNEQLKEASTNMEKRRICARKALDQLDWQDLNNLNIVPRGRKREELYDPESAVQLSAEYCRRKGTPDLQELKKRVDIIANSIESSKKENVLNELNETLKDAGTEQSVYAAYIRWIFIQHGFRDDELIVENYLPDDFELRIKEGKTALERIQDRRQSQRSVVDCKATLSPRSSNKEKLADIPAKIRNFCAGGTSIATFDIDNSSVLDNPEFEITFIDATGEEHKNIGEVIYSRKQSELNIFGIKWNNGSTS